MITDNAMIEGAYLAGFEPSDENLTGEALLTEIEEYLFNTQFN